MLKRYAIVAAGVAAFAIYDQYDKTVNYVPVEARVTTVNDTCYMEKKDGNTRWTSDVLDCKLADYAVKNHPKWLGYDVKHKIDVKFAFVSPVDGQTHKGSRTYSELPNGQPVVAGGTIQVRASTRLADKTREM